MTWADRARKAIDRVRLDTGLTGSELRKELRSKYPFGERKGYPYRIWLDEVARVCGRSRKTKSNNYDLFDD